MPPVITELMTLHVAGRPSSEQAKKLLDQVGEVMRLVKSPLD
jgi:hypothetical protein